VDQSDADLRSITIISSGVSAAKPMIASLLIADDAD
jgi:hypothetical protein